MMSTKNGTLMVKVLCLGVLLLALCPATLKAGEYTSEYGALVDAKNQWVAFDQQQRGLFMRWQAYRAQLEQWYHMNSRNPQTSQASLNYVVGELNRSADVMNQVVASIRYSTNMIAQLNQRLVAEYNRGALQGQMRYDVNGNPIDNSWWYSETNGNGVAGNTNGSNGSFSGAGSNGSNNFPSQSQPRPNTRRNGSVSHDTSHLNLLDIHQY